MTSVRMDKWLWAARFFKTRALASKACDLGRIRSNGLEAKPAREVRVGDMLQVRNEGGEFEIEVLQLSEMRGPAAVAQTLYRETDASKEARLQAWPKSARRCSSSHRFPQRRPSKRDRRRIIQFRSGALSFCAVIDRCPLRRTSPDVKSSRLNGSHASCLIRLPFALLLSACSCSSRPRGSPSLYPAHRALICGPSRDSRNLKRARRRAWRSAATALCAKGRR